MKRLVLCFALAAAGWQYYENIRPDPIKVLKTVPATADTSYWPGITECSDIQELRPYPGRHSILVFYRPENPSCHELQQRLNSFLDYRPDVAVQMIVKNQKWADEYQVSRVPHVKIYDANGALLAEDRNLAMMGTMLLRRWITEETGLCIETIGNAP